MKIQAKLTSAFCVLALICLGVSLLGYWQVRKLGSALYEIGTVRLPSIHGLNGISEARSALAASQRILLLSDLDEATIAGELQRQQQAWQKAEQGWNLYEPLPQTAEEAVKWRAFVPAWQAWKQEYAAVNDLVAESRRTANPALLVQARERNRTTTAGLLAAVDRLLAELLAVNEQIVEGEKRHSVASRHDMVVVQNVMLLAAGVGVAAAIGLGVFMGRRIGRPVTQVADALTRVAQGDLTPRVDAPSQDEIGQMVGAMNDMVRALRTSEARLVEAAQLRARLQEAQKMEALGSLAAGVAHEFNNLLTGINGFVDLATASLPPDHEAGELLAQVRHGALNARALVRRILKFSQTGEEPARNLVDLGEVVRQTVPLITPGFPTNVMLAVDLDAGLPRILADSSQLQHVLMKLSLRGAQAIGAAGGTVRLGAQARQFSGGAGPAPPPGCNPGHYVCLTVSDNGRGMDDGSVAGIFEPPDSAGQAGEHPRPELSLVWDIVMAHDGAVEVASAPDRGTTFMLYFPTAETGPEAAI